MLIFRWKSHCVDGRGNTSWHWINENLKEFGSVFRDIRPLSLQQSTRCELLASFPLPEVNARPLILYHMLVWWLTRPPKARKNIHNSLALKLPLIDDMERHLPGTCDRHWMPFCCLSNKVLLQSFLAQREVKLSFFFQNKKSSNAMERTYKTTPLQIQET